MMELYVHNHFICNIFTCKGLERQIIMGSGFDDGFIGTYLQLQLIISAHTLNCLTSLSDESFTNLGLISNALLISATP
jgi:hypothetical protein